MTGDGFPVAHHIFPGNTADINALWAAIKDLTRRYSIRRVITVADRGMVSEEIIEELESGGAGVQKLDYILGMRLRESKEVSHEVLGWAGRYHKVADSL